LRFARNGRLTEANQASAQLFGFHDATELIEAARHFDFVDAQQRDELIGAACAGAVRLVAVDVDCQRKDGHPWTCRMVVLPPRDGSGTVGVDIVLVEDVGSRAEQEARRTREFLDSMLNGLPNPVFVKDERHRWVILNDSYCRFMGYRREELLGKSEYDFFPEAEADVFWAKDRAVFSGEIDVDENEELFTDAAGKTHVILTRKTLHTDTSERHLLLGVITDITERKLVEEELRRSRDELDRRVAERTAALHEVNGLLTADIAEREKMERSLRGSEERFRHLADSMPQIVWIAGADGTVEHLNVKWSEYTGLPYEGRGCPGVEQVHPEDLASCLERWAEACAAGTAFENECRLRRRDGVYRWHLARALPVRLESGNVEHWFGTATDIEDQKHRQEILAEDHRRKNEFLALLGHELRNPLSAIRIAVTLLQRSSAQDAATRRAHELIERQVGQMTRLIDDLLDVSRISQQKVLLRKERIDLVELVRTVLGDREESARAHGLSLYLALPPRPVFLDADPARLAQVLGNLLDNAERFTDPGGRIDVAVAVRDPPSVRVSVRDTGIGISKDTLARLFEPFVQGERGARQSGGLGLGLSLVRGLVQLHGGSVVAKSDGEGRGSEFVVSLPVAAEDTRSTRVSRPAPRVAQCVHRVLVIEDNADAAEALHLALTAAGHEVMIATTGEEGLQRAYDFHPRVVLSDIGLPGMSGYDVARTLRDDPAFASTHLIAITGFGQDEDQKRARDAGFERHLTKPFDVDALERLLASLVPRGDAARATA
jgi:PAS domain S-box-containing protein